MTVGVGAVDNTCKAPSDAGSMAIILISRGTMSGVTPLTDSLSKAIGYRSVSREDLVGRVNDHGEIANRIVESIGSATRGYEQFSRLRRPYVILMRLALLEYVVHDDLIYHGYSGHLLVPAFQHVLRVRINAASQALLHSDRTIASISEETGFYDQSSFTKQFSRHTGLTPRAYRRQYTVSSH